METSTDVCGNKGAGGADGMGNLFGYEGRGITPDEEGLSEVSSVGHQGGCRFTAPGLSRERGWGT